MARGRLPEAVTAEDVIAAPPEKRRLSPRTAVSALMALLLIPLTLVFGPKLLGDRSYYAVSLLMVLEAMLPFFLTFEGRNPRARELVVTAVLCALGVAGRAAFFMLPQCKPVLALTILAGAALGGETGFLVGAVTMLVSNILFSQGPWRGERISRLWHSAQRLLRAARHRRADVAESCGLLRLRLCNGCGAGHLHGDFPLVFHRADAR